jgi:hypothetical protein
MWFDSLLVRIIGSHGRQTVLRQVSSPIIPSVYRYLVSVRKYVVKLLKSRTQSP